MCHSKQLSQLNFPYPKDKKIGCQKRPYLLVSKHYEYFLIFWPIVQMCAAKVELSFKGKLLPQRKHYNRCVIPNSSQNSTSPIKRTRKLVAKRQPYLEVPKHYEYFLIVWPIVQMCAAKVELSFKGKLLPQRKHNNRWVIPNSSHSLTSCIQSKRKSVAKGSHIYE